MNKKGFTLIEFVIVILLTGIIAGILSILIREVASTYTFIKVRGVALADNRLAIDRMTREIRQIASATTIYTAETKKIEFGKIGGERVLFEKPELESSLMRNNDVLADVGDEGNLTFTYYDVNNAELTPPKVYPDETDVWRILIKLTIKKGDETVKFQSQIHPRNL